MCFLLCADVVTSIGEICGDVYLLLEAGLKVRRMWVRLRTFFCFKQSKDSSCPIRSNSPGAGFGFSVVKFEDGVCGEILLFTEMDLGGSVCLF